MAGGLDTATSLHHIFPCSFPSQCCKLKGSWELYGSYQDEKNRGPGQPRLPQQLYFEADNVGLLRRWLFGSLDPADSCVLSGSWNAGRKPAWPLHPDSPGQIQVALVEAQSEEGGGEWGIVLSAW